MIYSNASGHLKRNMSEKILLEERYETGDISYFKNDYKIKILIEKGEEESHTISYTSQEVIDILEDGSVELVTTVDSVKCLKGDEKRALSVTGQKDKTFLPPQEAGQGFPQEELEMGNTWERELSMVLAPQIKWPEGNIHPMKIHYTLEGVEEINEWLCAKIKQDSSLIIRIPSEEEEIKQIRKATGYIYFAIDDGKLIKSTSHISNIISSNGNTKMETIEDLTIELIDFDWEEEI